MRFIGGLLCKWKGHRWTRRKADAKLKRCLRCGEVASVKARAKVAA